MTRDEAVKLVTRKAPFAPGEIAAKNWVELWLSLGMLKLDEPKSAREKFLDEMGRRGHRDNSSFMMDALDAFDASQK